jgi:hypothetical protein
MTPSSQCRAEQPVELGVIIAVKILHDPDRAAQSRSAAAQLQIQVA